MAESTVLQASLTDDDWVEVAAAGEQALVTVGAQNVNQAATVQLVFASTKPAATIMGHVFVYSQQSPSFTLGSANTDKAWIRSTSGTLKISYTVI